MMEIELCNVQSTDPLMRGFNLSAQVLEEKWVDTEFGSLLVAHQGADHRSIPSRAVLITFPDLGLNHVTNFQPFFSGPDMQLILDNFSVLHVNPPGQEEDAATLPLDFHYPTMDQMAEQLEQVCRSFAVRSIIGLGVGLGANVLTRFALRHPERVDGLFLINATASGSSWTEWLYQKRNIYYLGGVPQTLTGTFPQSIQDYLMWHHFGDGAEFRNRDLVYVYRQLFSGQHLNARNLSLLISSYIGRTDLALDRNNRQKNVRCPVLVACGHDGPHVDETVEFNGRLPPDSCTWMKLQDCGMLLEEQPGKVAEALKLFIQGLGYSLTNRRVQDRRASCSLSVTSDIPLTDDKNIQQSSRVVENPIPDKR